MGRVMVLLAAAMLTATALLGCAGATKRVNRRSESHVKYHASKQLSCDEPKLLATCLTHTHTGECSQYQVTGCENSVVYSNIAGVGWTLGE